MIQRRTTIFGGSGFIGRYLVERLADRGDVVTVAVRDVERARFLKPLGNVGQVTPVRAPVQDDAAVAAAVAGADAVVNLVGVLHGRGAQSFAALHGEAPGRIAAAAAAAGAGRLVHVSTLGAAPAAPSAYGRSKAAGEAAVRAAFPRATVLRPSVVFGTEDRFFNLFGQLARLLPALPLYGGGGVRFQPVYVGDVADAAAAALDDAAACGATYELGGPEILSFAELMRVTLRQTGRRRLLLPLPFAVGELQAALLELLPRPPLTRDQLRQLRVDSVVAAGARTLADLGVAPTGMAAILPTYLARYRPGGARGPGPRAGGQA